MSIRIRPELCRRCGRCAEICPGNLIGRTEAGEVYLRRPADCWGCAACVKECAAGALELTLDGAPGGRGDALRMERREGLCDWVYEAPGQPPVVITLDPRDANQY